MDLNGLIWTKNITPVKRNHWAYPSESIATLYPDLRIFTLHWRENKKDAMKPQEGN
jgi:hypothetical protein